MPALSPLAPTSFPELPPVAGVKLAAVNGGIKYKDKPEILLAVMGKGTHVAGVLTKSSTPSAAVMRCHDHLRCGEARALVVNSGNSNAFTGEAGEATVTAIIESAAKLVGCDVADVYTASTGVIGQLLPAEKITNVLPGLMQGLRDDAWEDAARAIMTTDTFVKMATRKVGSVTINGIAKGSGMIAPNMGTMLAFIFTDAEIETQLLAHMLKQANAYSFNCITVDGDISTSDTCLMFATGKAGLAPQAEFQKALTSLMTELAQLIVRDGEGASKFITIKVTGAEDHKSAHTIAMAIANSPLVKTAIAGEDANWGRIVGAMGGADARVDRDRLQIRIGGVLVARDGAVDPDYREDSIAAHMKGKEIEIEADAGVGKKGEATVWTCDLTHGYIDINGSYRS